MGRSCAAPGPWRSASVGAGQESFPCARWIRFEHTFSHDRRYAEEIALTYAKADATMQDDCAVELRRRISEEARRRDVSASELTRMWKEAERDGATLFGRDDGGALLAALAPREAGRG